MTVQLGYMHVDFLYNLNATIDAMAAVSLERNRNWMEADEKW